MDNIEVVISTPVSDKKKWVAPELQKVDIELITANFNLPHQLNEDPPSNS